MAGRHGPAALMCDDSKFQMLQGDTRAIDPQTVAEKLLDEKNKIVRVFVWVFRCWTDYKTP